MAQAMRTNSISRNLPLLDEVGLAGLVNDFGDV